MSGVERADSTERFAPAGDAAPVPEPKPADADEALKVAIKAAIDAGDVARAQALMTILVESPPDCLPPRLRMVPGSG